MTEPLIPFGRAPAAGASPAGALEPLARLVENIARLIDRLHPPGSAAMPPGLSGATARLRRSMTENPVDAASLAILSLKEILHEVESLRERTDYLDAASAKAFAELNTTEHRLRELSGHIHQLWLVLAHAPHVSEAVRGVATDTISDSDSRIQALRAALTAAPVASDSALADQVRTLREKAAALRKDHGRTSDDDVRQRHEVEMSELRRRHDDALAAQRAEADQNRAELAEQLAQTRRALAILEAESAQLRATGSASQTRLEALEERLEETGTAATTRQQAQDTTQATLRSELDSARLRISALETELAATESELAERESELSEREADSDSIAALHTRVSDLEADNRAVETDRDAALSQVERARSERDRCASELVAALAQIEDIEREMAHSSSARHRAIRDSDALREQLAQAQQQAELLTQVDDRLAALAAEQAREQASLGIVHDQLATTHAQHEQAQAHIAKLTTVHEAQRETIEKTLRHLDRLAFTADTITSDQNVAAKRAVLLEASRDWSTPDAAQQSAQALARASTELTNALHEWFQHVGDEAENNQAEATARAVEQKTLRAALTTAEQQLRQAHAHTQQHVETLKIAQAEQSRQAIRLEALDEELRTAQTELAHARAAAEAAVESAESGERSRRDGDQQRLAQSEANRAQAQQAATEATARATALEQRLHAVIAHVAAAVDLDERRDDAVVEEALARLHAHLEDIEADAASTRSQLRAAEHTRDALRAELTQVTAVQAAQAEHVAELETTLRSSEQQRTQLHSERDAERASAEARQRELIAARSELAATGADLASLHTTISELEERLTTAKTAHNERHGLLEELTIAETAIRASDERLGGLLSAIKMLGHAANEATDRVGVGLPTHSRNLTRTTARIERAEQGADPTVAVANARTVCERAAEQCEALATALANERQARRTSIDERDLARADIARLRSDVAGWEQQLSTLAEAQQAVVTAQAEQQRVHAALLAAEANAAEKTAAHSSDLRQQRANVEELSARLAASQDEAREFQEALRRATQEHARHLHDVQDRGEEIANELSAAVAEAQGRANSLTAAIDARDEELTKARQAVDRLRAGAADSAQQQARMRGLNTQLTEAVAELDQLRGERDQDRERLRSVAELEARVRELTQTQQAALTTARSAEAALIEQRTLLADAEQRAHRLQRTLDRQRAALSSALHEDPPTTSISHSSAPSVSAPDSPAL